MEKSPIRILHVVLSLEAGGMENGVVNLTNALNADGFDVQVCCLARAGEFAARIQRGDCIHVLDKPAGFSWRAVRSLAQVISRFKPQILHTHNLGSLIYGSLSSVLGARCAILHGEHSLLPPYEREPRRLRQRRWLYGLCRRIHTVSEGSREELVGLGYPAEKIVALLNGVDADRFAPGSRSEARRKIGLAESACILGMVGRFGPFKQHTLVIEAFNRLAVTFPDLHLLMVGDGGTERDRVRALAQRSSALERIHFAGLQHDLPPFYRAMDLLLVPSYNEGLSNVVLEAMACGVPALTHALPGHRELISHGMDGLVAELGSVEKLQSELENLLADGSKLAKMGKAARDKITARFSLKQMIQNYASLYRELAASGRS